MLILESRFSSDVSTCSCSACPGTHNIQLGSAVFSDLAMAEKVQPSPSERSRPWPCAGHRAAEQESWQSLEAHLPADPSICVDVTSKTAAHFGFSDVSYYSLKIWLIGQRMDSPIPCTFSTTDCTKLTMVANSTLIGAL